MKEPINQNQVNQKPTFTFGEIEKPYKEVDIAGVEYRIYVDDQAVTEYQAAIMDFRDANNELQSRFAGIDYDTISKEDLLEINDLQFVIVKNFITPFIGEDGYNYVFDKAGRTSRNLIPVVEFLTDVITNHIDSVTPNQSQRTSNARAQYLANNKR